MTNLLSNAIKYGGGKPIEVRVRRDEAADVARLEVIDHGPGIEPAMTEKIFEPFQRASSADEPIPGLGLGLYVVKMIVEGHGGTINVESQPGHGSRFIVELPCAAQPRLAKRAFGDSQNRQSADCCRPRVACDRPPDHTAEVRARGSTLARASAPGQRAVTDGWPIREPRLARSTRPSRAAIARGLAHLTAEDEELSGRFVTLRGRRHVNFGSCSYLGLETDLRLKNAACDAVSRYGVQFASSRAYVSCPPTASSSVCSGRSSRRRWSSRRRRRSRTSRRCPSWSARGDAVICDQLVHSSVQAVLPTLAARRRVLPLRPPQPDGSPGRDGDHAQPPPRPRLVPGRRNLQHARRPRAGGRAARAASPVTNGFTSTSTTRTA